MNSNSLLMSIGLGTLLTTAVACAADGVVLAKAQGIPHPAVIAHRGASYVAP